MSENTDTATEQGKVVIISGPSGSGKSTICKALTQHPRVWISISATTRPKRPYEEKDRHYYFITKDKFQQWIREDRFVEYAEIFGQYYGTPLSPVETKVKEGRIVLLDIDIRGQHIIREKNIESVSIFILPPTMEVLENRLRSRKTESEEQIQRRLKRAREEMDKAPLYDFQILNDHLPQAIEKVCQKVGLPYGDWLTLEKLS